MTADNDDDGGGPTSTLTYIPFNFFTSMIMMIAEGGNKVANKSTIAKREINPNLNPNRSLLLVLDGDAEWIGSEMSLCGNDDGGSHS
jgi:hypothetical protein